LGNFLKIWGDRKNARAHYSSLGSTTLSVDGKDPAGVALILLRRLIATGKMKKILNIESGLEMIAAGMAICSEVGFFILYLKHSDLFFLNKNKGVFPEMPEDVEKTLRRLEFSFLFLKKS
jgi:hypothetical protein